MKRKEKAEIEYFNKMKSTILQDLGDDRNARAIAGSINRPVEVLYKYMKLWNVRDLYGQPCDHRYYSNSKQKSDVCIVCGYNPNETLAKSYKPLGLPAYKKWKRKQNRNKRRCQKLNNYPSNPNWYKNRLKDLSLRDGKFCKQCGNEKNLSVDHIVELCISKDNSLKNLQILCWSCHKEKTRNFNRKHEFNKRTLSGQLLTPNTCK